MAELTILETNNNFTVSDVAILPAIIVGIEVFAALVTNLFVLVFTLSHPKSLKQSSIIFLTNFVLANLVMAILYMPTVVISAATGEWVFGVTLNQKVSSCQFVGFIFTHTIFLTTFTLTMISVDRFLFIVKPFVHKRLMKTWVAVLISFIAWVVSCLISILPLIGVGEYLFSTYNASCIPGWIDQVVFVAFSFSVVAICVTVIGVTSTWTFCFTHKFVKNSTQSMPISGSVYDSHIKKIVGIFGMMLLVTMVTYLPGLIGVVVGIGIGFENLPKEVYMLILISFYTTTISNPLIQSYFRKDLKIFVVSIWKKVFGRNCFRPIRVSTSVCGSTVY